MFTCPEHFSANKKRITKATTAIAPVTESGIALRVAVIGSSKINRQHGVGELSISPQGDLAAGRNRGPFQIQEPQAALL